MQGVGNVGEFIDPTIVPRSRVRIAAFDGENADPAPGRAMGEGVRAFTPWGELAVQLAGQAGYESIRANDEKGIAPGAENIRALFGGEPALILLDELSIFLRKAKKLPIADQLVPFLTSLFKAVEGTPNAAVVYTLAVGKGGKAEDAYAAENQFVADKMAEAESVSARKATLLDPTTEEETAQVVRRRGCLNPSTMRAPPRSSPPTSSFGPPTATTCRRNGPARTGSSASAAAILCIRR